MRNTYRVDTCDWGDNSEDRFHLTCNNAHVQYFSDETIARRTCDELNAQELILQKMREVNKFREFGRNCHE